MSTEWAQDLLRGYVWNEILRRDPRLADEIRNSEECIVLQQEIEDPEDLEYFREATGLLAFLADSGGVAVYDPQILKWWHPQAWRKDVFEERFNPRQHVVILVSTDAGETWVHTRGMRKFARPDLSIRRVPKGSLDDIIELCNRFIQLQTDGHVIPEGQAIRMKRLPDGLICRHGGSLEDPDFNNVHVEIKFPE